MADYFAFNYLPDPLPDGVEQPAPFVGCCEPGAGSPGGGNQEVFKTSGDPNGAVTATSSATQGVLSYDPATHSVWVKDNTGTNNTGWFQIIGP